MATLTSSRPSRKYPCSSHAAQKSAGDTGSLLQPHLGGADRSRPYSYWDQSKVEVNIAKQKNPLIGKIVSCARMVGPNAPGETCNIVIDHQGAFPFSRSIYLMNPPRRYAPDVLCRSEICYFRQAPLLGGPVLWCPSPWHRPQEEQALWRPPLLDRVHPLRCALSSLAVPKRALRHMLGVYWVRGECR